MKSFKQFIFETYSRENEILRKFLQEKPLDIAYNFYNFISWSGADEVLKRARISRKTFEAEHEKGGDKFYSLAERLEKKMTKDDISSFVDDILQSNPAEVPSWGVFGYHRRIPRNTWLIHFSNDASDISSNGFKYGISDVSRLSLTTLMPDAEKAYGGYNFAFLVDSRDAENAVHNNKYGKHAVMFQASGIAAYHYGDEEEQVIFWGPAINPGSLIYLWNTSDGWCVYANKTKRDCIFKGTFEQVANWVQRNQDQYRKKLFSLPPKDWYAAQRQN